MDVTKLLQSVLGSGQMAAPGGRGGQQQSGGLPSGLVGGARHLDLPPPAPETGFDPEHDRDAGGGDFRLVMLRAMIAAAHSDGHIDAQEHGRIRDQVAGYDLGAEEKSALYGYFAEPDSAATIAGLARTEAQKAEIYLASALSIDPDTPQETAYLSDLAEKLGLPQGLRDYLTAEAEAARAEVS